MHWAESVISELDAIWVPHHHYEQARADLYSAGVTLPPGHIIDIEGPTRAGKSTLIGQFAAEHTRRLSGSDTDMPIVTMTAENNSTNGDFSTKAFTFAALQAMKHPMFTLDPPDSLDVRRLRQFDRAPEGILRQALEQAIRYRRTLFFVIDELQHIAHIRGGLRNAAAFLDSLKCLASNTGTRLIYVGTYELTPLLQLSPHLLGRMLRIHLPRYRADVREDVIAFDQILASYSTHLRFDRNTSLRTWNEYLYCGSLGCMGLLKAWLRDALRKVMAGKDPSLCLRHFEQARRSESDLASIAREIHDGEKLLSQASSDRVGASTRSTSRSRPFRSKPFRHKVKAAGGRE